MFIFTASGLLVVFFRGGVVNDSKNFWPNPFAVFITAKKKKKKKKKKNRFNLLILVAFFKRISITQCFHTGTGTLGLRQYFGNEMKLKF